MEKTKQVLESLETLKSEVRSDMALNQKERRKINCDLVLESNTQEWNVLVKTLEDLEKMISRINHHQAGKVFKG